MPGVFVLRPQRIRIWAPQSGCFPGIGDIRKKQLLRAFGSLARLKKASVEEIAERVPGIGEAVARKILDNLAARPMPPPQTPSEPQT